MSKATNRNILVVDNHPAVRRFMCGLLEKNGHRVTTATDGLSALATLRTTVPDIMFVDLVMPNINGEKLCRIIRSNKKLDDIDIVILSALASEHELNFKSLGACACIAKGPFDELGKHVQAVLEKLESGETEGISSRTVGPGARHKRQMTRELLSTRRHIENVLENLAEGILELTRDGDIVLASRAAASLIGMPEEKFLGLKLLELFAEQDRAKIRKILEFESSNQSCEVALNDRVLSMKAIQVMNEEQASMVVVLEDMTERKRAEEERSQLEVQAQRAQRMESLGLLAGGMAHDFNNMLGAIMGYSELAMDILEPGSEVHGYIREVLVATGRAADTVEQILIFSRRAENEKSVVSLRAIIQESMNLLRSTLPSSITLRFEIAPDVPVILADATLVQQVIMNLGANGRYAMPEGGELSFALNTHHVDASEAALNPQALQGEYAQLTVADTGCGMPTEVVDRIFEPFFTTKEVGEGSGMGLATSHGIITNHGGFISVESEVGVGSVFHVFFPATEGDPGKEIAHVPEQSSRGQERILVIDDESAMLEMVSSMLRSLGYVVTSFLRSCDALAALQRSPDAWDLLITDQTMPKMGGIEMLQATRSLRSGLPVVIMTGHSDKLTQDADGGVGADAVIRKPFRRSAAAKLIRQLLDSRRQGSDLPRQS